MKMKSNTVKKGKKQKIITTVAAAISSVALLTTATYAWFSLTNSPQVNQLTLKAGTSGSLQISNSNTEGFGDAITLSLDAESCLKPLTTINGTTFYKPVYGNTGVVESVETTAITAADIDTMANKTEADGGWLIKKTFYLKANTESSNVLSDVGIKLAAPIGNTAGTTIDNSGNTHAAEAVRVSFTCNGTTKVVEPNADASVATANPAQAKLTGWDSMSVIKQGTNHLFAVGGGAYDQQKSEEMFRIPVNQAVEVTMYIWLEGADKDCVNEIIGNSINVQLRFISDDLN